MLLAVRISKCIFDTLLMEITSGTAVETQGTLDWHFEPRPTQAAHILKYAEVEPLGIGTHRQPQKAFVGCRSPIRNSSNYTASAHNTPNHRA